MDMTAEADLGPLELPAAVVLTQRYLFRVVGPFATITAKSKFVRNGEHYGCKQQHRRHEDTAAHAAKCPAAPIATAAQAVEGLLPP